jgi:UDP-N-acetylglucosamine diphosphorylase / glucose-1-phosphate thymidylyltransferase / UDP-N-acetylgalactosamine diphosphorylase / glucosamine-1-phosphate N-acetyltransferase / galactosamine-1-phosphate N-acetyltransferase
MRLVIYEGKQSEQLYPLTEMHAAWDLLIGGERLGVRLQRAFALDDCRYQCRQELTAVMAEAGWSLFKGEGITDTLFVNGLAVELPEDEVLQLQPGERLVDADDNTVAFRLAAADQAPQMDEDGYLQAPDYPSREVEARLIREPWDLLTLNEAAIRHDFTAATVAAELPGVTMIEPGAIAVHPQAVVQPGVILDASHGPITIGSRTEIGALSVIQGPVHIATSCRIKPHSHIYDATSLGPQCRIGGEVENTICHSYVNKQHQGFVGHSLLMPWTNLGADTNTSDLKNNYSPVRISRRGMVVDSGQQFLGLLLGDHSKSAINTQFNTGTVTGLFAQIFEPGFPAKEIPPFSWGGREAGSYRLQDALNVAQRVMERRKLQLTGDMRQLIERLHREATG